MCLPILLHFVGNWQSWDCDGMIFVNCMEKLTMNAPRETLRVRLCGALDAGIDGITLSAGLHLGSFALMEDNPRFAMPNWASSFPRCAPCSCSCARMPG